MLNRSKHYCLSVIIPCFNEEGTVSHCVERLRQISDEQVSLEIIIVDDGSTDRSLVIAQELARQHPNVKVISVEINQGKGAALRLGFQVATGDFVAVQDADLEYDPRDLRMLLEPLIAGNADVVLGSRFTSVGAHRVLYFWHYLGNRLLTFISNMFTDLNLTDMETCYKVFTREVIKNIKIEENRFGFEPEIVAKIAHQRLRIYEMGVSYSGRTYEEGKKIGFMDGLRALYCIVRYNAHKAPLPLQFMVYLGIGSLSALVNYLVFVQLYYASVGIRYAAPIAFITAAATNYILSIAILFRHKARWSSAWEVVIYAGLVIAVGALDLAITAGLYQLDYTAESAKVGATLMGLLFNFAGRRFIIFPEPASGPWKPSR